MLSCYLKNSAAFDSVDHDILLDKLHMIGVRGDALRWVESYLSARTQVIRIGDATSQPTHLLCGVPQGSVLGPLLFNIYCHDLGSVFVKHGVHYHMYADDTQLYVGGATRPAGASHRQTILCNQGRERVDDTKQANSQLQQD